MSLTTNDPVGTHRTTFPAPDRPGIVRTAIGVFLGLIAFCVVVIVLVLALSVMFGGSITGTIKGDTGISQTDSFGP